MVFSSTVFLLLFLPLVAILYYLCPRRGRNAVLLIASLISWLRQDAGSTFSVFIDMFRQ